MKRSTAVFAWILAAVLVMGGTFTVRSEASARGVTEIRLDTAGSSAAGAGVDIRGSEIAICSAGTYRVSGTLEDGQLLVRAGKGAEVTLILDGADISNESEAAILVEKAGRTVVQLAEGSVNRIRSGAPAEITADAADESASGGALHAKDDLVIEGTGALTVLGYVNNGIHCSNRLAILGGEIEVEAVNNGVKGKDGVTVSGGRLTIRSGGNGINADAEDGEGYGVIDITGGEISIESFGDGAQAATALTVSGGSVEVISGGGSAAAEPKQSEEFWGRWNRGEDWELDGASDGPSTKGLKAGALLTVSGGAINIDAVDDALHSNGEVRITGGTLALATGDDGVHADDRLTMSAGTLCISASYEGMEANQILISGGEIDLTADDDGINANGGQSMMMGRGFGGRGGFGGSLNGQRGGLEGRGMPDEQSGPDGQSMPWERGVPDGQGQPDMSDGPGMPGEAQAEDTSEPLPTLRITGGTLHINAEGDGLDSNGDLIVEGGTIVVDGPSRGGNGALDSGSESGGTCIVNGGTVLAIGDSSMAESFGGASGQCSFICNFSGAIEAGARICVADSEGNVLFEHTAAKRFSSVVFSCAELKIGESCVLTAGDQSVEIAIEAASNASGERSRWGR